MVPVKQAIQYAIQFLRDIYEGQALDDLRLEEVELAEDEKSWNITLSFLRPGGGVTTALALPRPRDYKVVTVSTDTGAVRAMKIRDTPWVTT